MCVQNNIGELQVFDENEKDESSVPEPIANVGKASHVYHEI